MNEIVIAKLKEREKDTHVAPFELENCEVCGHLMPEGCIGWCSTCPGDPYRARAQEWEAFYTWGGWRRAFGEYTDEEWECVKGRTTCGRVVQDA